MDVSSVGDRQVDGSTCTAVVSCLQQARDRQKKKNLNNNNSISRAVDRSIIAERENHHLGQIISTGLAATARNKIDPYQELELYLARVIEEIDEIIVTSLPSQSIQASIPVKKLEPTIINSNNNNDDNNSSDGITIEDNLNGESLDRNQAKQSETQQLASRVSNKLNSPTSKTLSVAVPPLIAHTRALNNINIDKTTTTATPVIEYRDLLSEFGLLDSDGTESCPDSNNSSEYYDKQLLSISEDSISDSNVKQSSHIISINNNNNESKDNLTGKGERSAEVEAKKISGSWPGIDYANKIIISNTGSHKTDDKLLLSSSGNSSSLPASLDCRKDYKNSEIVQPNKLSNYGFDKTINSKCTVNDVKCCCKPPRQVNDTNCKNNSSPMSRRCRSSTNSLTKSKLSASRTEEETTDADYDDVFIDDKVNLRLQFIDTTARSAPVTPTDEKSLPFSKLFRKKYPLSSSCSNNCNLNARMTDAILVRVSSLPDQDLLDITNDKNNHHHHHHHHHHQEFNRHPMKKKRRAISPLTLRSDITAKRLSESDKDVSQISPVQLKTFFPLNNNGHNDVAVGCDLPSGRKNSSDTSIESGKSDKFVKNEFRKAPNDDSSRSVSLPISLTALFSRLRNGGSCCPNSQPMETFNCSNMATQTSPAISRSSSFTWVSDCDSPRAESHVDDHSLQDESALDLAASPQDTVDDDNRSSSSSQDLVQSLDEISSGSTSPDNTDRASPLESGIGTASPPRSTDRRSIKPLINNKCCRKETWERIRRRPSKLNSRSDKNSTDVWVRRESVYTQTRNQDKGSQEAVDSSSGVDDTLPRTKLSRPKDLIIDISSSLSSGEMLESLEISSPNSHIQPTEEPAENTDNQEAQIPPLHFQPDYQLSEIEAQEACKWLRAAGFPQYAQMYEDYQFPIDVSGVAKDHPFLEADSLQSLYRRLDALNRCANMKLDTHHTHHHHHSNHHHNTSHSKTSGGGGGGRDGGGDDSDEDTQCALSENWTFEKKTRRWSRICDISQANVERLQAIAAGQLPCPDDSLEDRLETDDPEETMIVHGSVRFETISSTPNSDDMSPKFRRTGSERLRDGAKAFLRRVESLKSRRRKRQNREGVVISGPQVLDVISMQQKMKDLNCVDVSPTGLAPVSFGEGFLLPSPNPPSSPVTMPNSPYHLPSNLMTNTSSPFGDDSSSYCSDGSQSGTNTHTITSSSTTGSTKTKFNKAKRFLYRGGGGGMKEDQGTLSDSECQPSNWRHKYLKDANSNHTKVLEYLTSQSPAPVGGTTHSPSISTRGGSLNLGKDSQRYREKITGQSKLNDKELKVVALKREDKFHRSFRHAHDDLVIDRKQQAMLIKHHQQHQQQQVTVYREKSRSRSSELAASQESSSTMASRDSDPEDESPRHKGTVVRWHSFQRGSLYPEPLDPLCPRAMASMSCGQLLVLRKLALLKLTACMERYCPTHRTGWNWELPKFIRKIKTPDYKDKTVFGVPLLLSLQRTGQALPKCIQIALRWLRANALDQVGIFRKSGVRSRIQKLKAMTEVQGDNINFDGQQAFDVADLVKQYFRELPEALLTNKLSETFIAIFQHVPVDLRPDAVQSVLLLLPDEHREALETLLDFLNHVASNSPYNQMTASNLAVCLAPSLFHLNHNNSNSNNRSSSVSPRRRKTVGIPDQRELSENKAAHDCLLYLVKMHRELFMVSSDMLTQCHFNYMEESVPVGLEELGSEMKQDWRGYMYVCTTALLKEAREKSRGWVTVSNPADSSVEMAYKKVGDGHPLRLWRVSTEVEAPPHELLHRVLRERHIWDPQLLKYRMVKKLDANAEIFQYAAGNMSPLPARDYCVLRTWRTDLPKDACVIVETSVQHPDAPVMLGGTRGIVLASRYLIEKSGSGKSRIMHLSRVDTKGRTPEWYNKSYGHIAALYLSKIRNSFKHSSDGPESKV